MYEKTVLASGSTLLTHYMPNRISISVGIWVKAGSRYENKNISGISHFLEHLIFKGTKRLTCEQIKQSIEGIGGSLNAFTAEEFTCYMAKFPCKYLGLVLDILGEMVLNASLTPEDIEMERKVILEEIRMYKDLPGHFAIEQLMKLLWPEQPLGMNIAGEISSINSIDRNRLFTYKQKFYQLNNIIIVGCGNLKHREFLEECEKYFSLKAANKINRFVKVRQGQRRPRIRFQVKDIEQTHLAFGLHSLPRSHPGRFSLSLLNIILGANMSSRLFREVREKRGLAYEIGTYLKFFQDTGAFVIHAGIDNQRVIEAIDVILEQLEQIKKDRVEEEELNRAKEYYIGQLMLALEDTSEHMLWLGEKFTSLDRILYPEEIVRKVNEIKAEDLKQLANKILERHRLNLVLIGPLKDKDKKRIEQRLAL